MDRKLIDKNLEIIEGRARSHQNGATWQLVALNHATAAVVAEVENGVEGAESVDGPDTPVRREAIARMLKAYIANQKSGAPVHTWSTDVH